MNTNGLPTGWSVATIGDLIGGDGVFVDGDWIETKDQDPEGDVRLIQLADIGDGAYKNKSNRYLTHQRAVDLGCAFLNIGDILVARMPDPLGRACIFPGDKRLAVTAVDVCIVRTSTVGVNNRWLMYTVNSPEIRSAMAALQSGSTRKRISRSRLATIKFPVPPLNEQRRISDKIEELFTQLDAGVVELRKAQAHLKRYRQAVLKAAVTGELTREWRTAHKDELEPASEVLARILKERRTNWETDQLAKMQANGKTPSNDEWKKKYKEPPLADSSALPLIPDTWTWATIDAISTKVVDGVHKKPNYVPSGIPFVTVKNLTAGPGISFDKLNYVSEDDHRAFIKRANPERGDLLVSKDGTLGVTRRIRTNTIFSIFVSVALIKPVLPIMSGYLEVAMSSPQVQSQMVPKGSGLQHIHLEDLRLDCIPFGSLEEQEMIVREVERCLSIADAMDQTIQSGLKQTERLRQSILKHAFEGNLVEQDPTDEPAELLLEQIKKEREEREAEKQTATKLNRKLSTKNRSKRTERPAA